MPRRTTHQTIVKSLISGLVVGIVAILGSANVQAGPITNGPNNAPFTKLGVYGGVLTILDGTRALEIGNNGRDIGSTGDLYFRPSGLTQANGLRVFRNGSVSDVLVTGQVCLFGTGSPDCRNVWPAGGGSSYWQVSGAYLIPNLSTYSVGVGDGSNRVTGLTALTVQSTSGRSLTVVNTNTGGSAIKTDGNLALTKTLVGGTIRINGYEVYHPWGWAGVPANDGRFCSVTGTNCTYDTDCNPEFNPGDACIGTGADADLIEGQNIELKPGSFCKNDGMNGNALVCLCVTMGATTRCSQMWNHI